MGRLIVLDTSILDMAETAGQLARRYRTSHHSIEVPDYLIAATAHQLGAENPERPPWEDTRTVGVGREDATMYRTSSAEVMSLWSRPFPRCSNTPVRGASRSSSRCRWTGGLSCWMGLCW